MAKLFLLRHFKSQWNEENRFTGWVDVPLLKGQEKRAKTWAKKIFGGNKIDFIYSSSLFRNMDTIAKILEYTNRYPVFIHMDKGRAKDWSRFIDLSGKDIPVCVTEKLNERFYGKLQGMDKKATMKKYGEEKVRLWRRSYDIAPPHGESLRDVFARIMPFYRRYIEKHLRGGKNILIIGSHNPLRAIAKHIEKISDNDIINFEIEFGGLLEYDFDDNLKVKDKKIIK